MIEADISSFREDVSDATLVGGFVTQAGKTFPCSDNLSDGGHGHVTELRTGRGDTQSIFSMPSSFRPAKMGGHPLLCAILSTIWRISGKWPIAPMTPTLLTPPLPKRRP